MKKLQAPTLSAIVLTLGIAFVSPVFAQRHDDPGRQHGVVRASGIGVITGINVADRRITLEHETIDKLKMPPATHEFKLKSSQTAGKLKQGDKVAFDLEKSGRDLKVVRLSKRE